MPPNLEMRVFIVKTGALPTLRASRIEAAYYKTEDGFTTFKDVDNQAVYTVRDDHLVSVERAHGAEPLIAAFAELLTAARKDGHASGRIGMETSESPDGVVTTTGYDITVGMVEGVDASRSTAAPVEMNVSGRVPTEADLAPRAVQSNRRG